MSEICIDPTGTNNLFMEDGRDGSRIWIASGCLQASAGVQHGEEIAVTFSFAPMGIHCSLGRTKIVSDSATTEMIEPSHGRVVPSVIPYRYSSAPGEGQSWEWDELVAPR